MSTPQPTGAGLTSINVNIMQAIMQECMAALDQTPTGAELYSTRVSLTEAIYKALGDEIGCQFEDFASQTTMFYGEQAFRLGLQIGRDPAAVLTLPDSEYTR